MASQQFWDKWLLVVGWVLSVFGLLLAFANQTWLFDIIFNRHVNTVFWPSNVAMESIEPFQAWIYGVLGATVSGWGVFIVFLARQPFKRRERWAWNCIFAGITLWFFPDTAISVYFGVFINVAFNIVVATVVYLPLVATRHQFKNSNA